VIGLGRGDNGGRESATRELLLICFCFAFIELDTTDCSTHSFASCYYSASICI
jgi:hypothetical protein